MRILLSCQQSLQRHRIPAYEFWRSYFRRGLEEAGHQVVEVPGVDWAEGLVHPPNAALRAWRDRTWQTVRRFVRSQQSPIDLFVSYLFPKQVDAGAIRDLERLGIPSVNFFCDNVREFPAVPEEFRPFSLHWVPEFEALPMYRAAGLPHVCAPMPCWIPPHLRNVPERETEPPTFIGSADILRRDLLGRAVQTGAPITIRGTGWREEGEGAALARPSRRPSQMVVNQMRLLRNEGVGPLARKAEAWVNPVRPAPIPQRWIAPAPATQEEYFGLTRGATVCLGVSRVPTLRHSHRNPLRYSRLRDVEAPMLGACYLTEWTEGLEHLFEPGVEVATYRTADELASKLKELERDPARRRSMRARAQQRALLEHSVARSMEQIAARIGFTTATA